MVCEANILVQSSLGPGTHLIRGRISDGTATRDYETTLIINDLPPSIRVDGGLPDLIEVNEGATTTLTGSYENPGGGAVTLTTSIGSITNNPTTKTFTWTFSPTDNRVGVARETITITDAEGSKAELELNIVVSNVAPQAVLVVPTNVLKGATGVTVSLTELTDASATDLAAGLRFSFDFGDDGSFEIGDGTYAGGVTAATAGVPASLLVDSGSLPIRARIIDKDGGFTEFVESLVIANLPLTITSLSASPAQLVETSLITLTGSFAITAGANDTHVIRINWGDGQVDRISASNLISLRSPGSGYANATNVPVIGGSGTAMTIDIATENGKVIDVAIRTAGNGYVVGDLLRISGGSGDATFRLAAFDQVAGTFTAVHDYDLSNPKSMNVLVTLSDDDGGQTSASLTLDGPPSSLVATIDGSNNLTVRDVDATGKNNLITISVIGGNYVVTDENEMFQSAPLGWTLSDDRRSIRTPVATFNRSITIVGSGGNDTLTVDLSSGDAIPLGGLFFNGDAPNASPGDKVVIIGGVQGTTTYNYAGAGGGSVAMSAYGTIHYGGVEQVTNSGTANNVIVNLPAGPIEMTLGDDGLRNELSRLSGTNVTTIDFRNPTTELFVNRSNGIDTVVVQSMPDFTAGLTLGTQALPLGTINFAGTLSLAANQSLSAFASQTISLSGESSDLSATGQGSIRLSTERNIFLNPGSSITTQNGSLMLDANQQAIPTSGGFNGVTLIDATVEVTGNGNLQVRGRGGDDVNGEQQGVGVFGSARIIGGTSGTVTVDGTGGASTGNINRGISLFGETATIGSSGAYVVLLGRGGGVGPATFGVGVSLRGGADITVGGDGDLSIQGSGASTASDTNHGVEFSDSTVSVNNGDIRVTNTGGQMRLSGATSFETTSDSIFELITDDIRIDSTATISNPNGQVRFASKTTGREIDLGTKSIGTLGLTDAELDRVTAGTLRIGDLTAAQIRISQNVDRIAATAIEILTGDTMLFDGGSINSAGGDVSITALRLDPGTSGVDVTTGAGSLVLPAGTLDIAIDGTNVDTQYQQLRVTGAVDLTRLDLNVAGTYTATPGDSFVIVSATGPVTGPFANVNLPAAPNNAEWELVYELNQVRLELKSTGITIAATDANKNEGNTGTTPFTFTVTRSGDLSGTTTVSYAVTGSGANPANASDFIGGVFPAGTIVFAANQLTETITINVNGDTDAESDETFVVRLRDASEGVTFVNASATGVIRDDDRESIQTRVITPSNVAAQHIVVGDSLPVAIVFEALETTTITVLTVGHSFEPHSVRILDHNLVPIGTFDNGVASAIVQAGTLNTIIFDAQTSTQVYTINSSAGAAALGGTRGTNIFQPTDTNGDGSTTPLDALGVLIAIGSRSRFQDESLSHSNNLLDVNQDGLVTPLDALLVLIHIRDTNNKNLAEGMANSLAYGQVGATPKVEETERDFISLSPSTVSMPSKLREIDSADNNPHVLIDVAMRGESEWSPSVEVAELELLSDTFDRF